MTRRVGEARALMRPVPTNNVHFSYDSVHKREQKWTIPIGTNKTFQKRHFQSENEQPKSIITSISKIRLFKTIMKL
jgi:hypothetical protein